MLLDTIKARIAQAVKEKDDVARDVLRLAFGEAQTAEARAQKSLSDDETAAIVRKLVKSNEETLAAIGEDPRANALKHEIAILGSLLPKSMSADEIVAALASQRDAIRAAKNDGQATGIAMKHLKSTGATFDGTVVATAVKTMRA